MSADPKHELALCSDFTRTGFWGECVRCGWVSRTMQDPAQVQSAYDQHVRNNPVDLGGDK